MSSEDYILQANELGVNAFATTKKYRWICQDTKLVVNFMLSKRIGCTQRMVLDTVANYLHAAKCLWNDEFEAGEKFINRKPYEDDTPLHGEARVNIFGDLLVDGGKWTFPVNICNEFTSAQNILSFANTDFANDVNLAAWGCHPVTNGNGKPKPQQQSKPDEPVDLAKEFPRQDNQSMPSAKEQSQLPSGVDIIDFDYKQKAMYEAKYKGKPVAVNVSKLKRVINAKKDGTGSYECIEVFGWYDGLPSTHPIYDLRMFAPKEDQQFGDWQTLFKSFNDGRLANPGDEWFQPMHLVYKLNQSKKEGDNRVFWNLSGVSLAGDYIPDDDYSDAPDWGVDDNKEPTLPLGDEIPWDDGPDNDPGRHLDM